jgi:LacI family transcriptional regulator
MWAKMPRDPKLKQAAPVGIKDIARELGVSIGTVDRALNGKPDISAATRARVLDLAKQLGYTPNLAARYLQSRKPVRISVHLPRRIALFWDALRDGIHEAAAPFAPALHVDYRSYSRLGDGDIPLLEAAIADGTDGLIIAPGNPTALAPHLREAARRNIPVVCVVTDAPDSPRLLSVSADPFTVGAVAGELLGRFTPASGQVGFFTGWLATQDHADKLRGFVSSLSASSPGLSIGPIIEAHDDEREAHQRARAVFRAAEEEGRLDGLTVITTDLFPELVDWIRAGKVAATVYQRPLSQGRVALQALYQFLQRRERIPDRQRVVPYVVMRSNVDLVLERLSADKGGEPDRPAATRRAEKRTAAPRQRATPRPRTNA